MKKLIALSIVVCISIGILCAQEGKLEFTQIKPTNDGYTVYFHVKGIKDESHAQEILEDLLNDNNILRGRYFKSIEGKDRYQLYINEFVTAEYIREILKTHGTDYDFSTVSIDGIAPNKTPRKNPNEFPESPRVKLDIEDFPEYKSTGNKVEDDEKYRSEKDKWINEHPEEYEKLSKEMKKSNDDKIRIEKLNGKQEPIKADGFPQYKNTGQKNIDNNNYTIEKDEWIKNNPQKYQRMLQEMQENTEEKIEEEKY